MAYANPCPCGSNQPYPNCCQVYLSGEAFAPTAEKLMRSRYTAFTRGNVNYLLATRHPQKRSEDSREKLQQTIDHCHFFKLEIIDTQKGCTPETEGEVTFVAHYRTSGVTEASGSISENTGQLSERSRFLKEGGRWYYYEGFLVTPNSKPPTDQPVTKKNFPGRNDPCWCGSGKKFKRCHNHQ